MLFIFILFFYFPLHLIFSSILWCIQTRFQNPPLKYKPDIDKLIQKLHVEISEKREWAIIANQAQTLMDYLIPTLREANTVQLPDLPKGVVFDFNHKFLQMLENNPIGGIVHEDHMQHLRKFIKLTNTVRQNCVPTKYIRLYVFPFSLNGKAWD